MKELSVLLKKEEGYTPMVIDLPNTFHFSKNEKPAKTNISKIAKTDRTPIAAF